ncbi:MAG: O-antigen ligase family protein [Bacteroidota bacterium]
MSVEIISSRQRWLHIYLFLVLPIIWWTDLPDPGWAPRLLATATILIIVTWNLLNYIANDMLRSKATLFWILFVLWSAVMSLAARSVGDALLETLHRGTGFVLAVCFGGMIRLLPDRVAQISRWSAVSVIWIFILFLFDALPQWFGMKASTVFPSVDFSFGATFGNKNFLAESLLMLVFFLPNGLKDVSSAWRRVTIVSLVISFLLIAMLKSLAVFTGLIVALCYYVPARIHLNKVIRVALPLIIISIIWMIPAVRKQFKDQYENFKTPLDSTIIDSAADNSISERTMMFRNSYLLYQEQPFIGIGVTDWRIEQARYGMGGTEFLDTGLSRFEHPHNEFVLALNETGFPGLLFLLVALLLLFSPVRTRLENSDVLASRAAVIAMSVVACFAYPFSGDVPWYYFMSHVGVLLASVCSPIESVRGNKLSVVSLLLAGIVMAACYGSFNRIRAEFYQGQGIAAQLKREQVLSAQEYGKSGDFFHRMDRTGTPMDWYLGNALFRSGDTINAILALERASVLNPYHARIMNDLGTMYEKYGETLKAISCYQEAVKLVPGLVETRLNLAATYYNAGRTSDAFREISALSNKERIGRKNRDVFLQFSLVIGRQLALEDSLSMEEGRVRRDYLNRVWEDEKIRSCMDGNKEIRGFLSCMRSQ